MQETAPSPMGGRLVLVRHGQTDWNLAGRMQGTTDIPLNQTGRDQAREAGRELATTGEDWDLLVSSPLSRAHETAQIIGEALGLEVSALLPELVERHYGAAEGAVLSYADSRHPQELYPDVEPIATVYHRGIDALRRLVLDHPGESLVVVSHGTLIRRVLMATTPGDWQAGVANATPLEVDLEGLFAWDPEDDAALV